MEERPGINNSTITALISVKWKVLPLFQLNFSSQCSRSWTELETNHSVVVQELSEEDRKVWNDQAAEAMEAYKKELEEYNKSVAASIQDWRKCSSANEHLE